MAHLIDRDALLAEIERLKKNEGWCQVGKDTADVYYTRGFRFACERIISFIDTLEVKDPYEQYVQHPSIKDGIKAHAETYSFNIESELFNQLTKEQQALWRKEIEQACISGGDAGVELARDTRYKENLEVEEVDFEKIWEEYFKYRGDVATINIKHLAKHFFELGLKVAQKGE